MARRVTFTSHKRTRIWKKTGGVCYYCGLILGSEWSVDHVQPHSVTADNSLKNLVPSCNHCNNLKADMLLKDFRLELYGRYQLFYFEANEEDKRNMLH